MSKGKQTPHILIVCESCGQERYVSRAWAKYCSTDCRLYGWINKRIEKKRDKNGNRRHT